MSFIERINDRIKELNVALEEYESIADAHQTSAVYVSPSQRMKAVEDVIATRARIDTLTWVKLVLPENRKTSDISYIRARIDEVLDEWD